MIRRVASLTSVALACLLAAAPNVLAQERTCKLDPDTGLLRCILVAQPSPPRSVQLGDLPLVWKRIPLQMSELISRGIGCVRTIGDVTEIGAGYVIILENTETNEQLYFRYVCTWPDQPPPQPPPRPPTAGELRDANAQALALQPSINPSLSIGGLTGLDSWLWCQNPGPVATGVTLRGWTANGQVELVQVGWDVSGPDHFSLTSPTCGSEEMPAATWTPDRVGDYGVTLTAVWAGSWDLSWLGVPMGTFPLGPITLTSTTSSYPVDEYRGELTG